MSDRSAPPARTPEEMVEAFYSEGPDRYLDAIYKAIGSGRPTDAVVREEAKRALADMFRSYGAALLEEAAQHVESHVGLGWTGLSDIPLKAAATRIRALAAKHGLGPSALAVMGWCVGHLGPPNNTADPHPRGATCLGWKPIDPSPAPAVPTEEE